MKEDLKSKIFKKEWKLFDGAKVEHLCGKVFILTVHGQPEVSYCVQNGFGEPISPDVHTLSEEELRAIADHKEKNKEPAIIPEDITNKQIFDACFYYDHGFGLLGEEERRKIIFEAKEWISAWRKALS